MKQLKKRLMLWRLMDIGIWFVCGGVVSLGGLLLGNPIVPSLFAGAFQCFLSMLRAGSFQSGYYMAVVGLVLLLLAALVVLVFTFPVIILYYGVSFAARKNQLARVQCDGLRDMDYFRDELRGVSPATISLLMDLRIEVEKDLTATLLSLELKRRRADTDLLPSERELQRLMQANQLDLAHIAAWQQVCVREAERAGYIRRNKRLGGFVGRLAVLAALFVFCVVQVFATAQDVAGSLDALDGEAPYAEALLHTDIRSIPELFEVLGREMERPEVQSYLDEVGRGAVLILNALLAFLLPGVILVYVLVHFLSRPRFVRTFSGKVLMGQIAGLRNFIHDFSNLKDADREQLALWDHFLVYAVVLEENTEIVREIGRVWNLDLSKFLLNLQ